MKKLIACVLTLALALTAVCAMAEGSLTFSWWGGDARHEATQQAVDAFKAATGIDVTVHLQRVERLGRQDEPVFRF